MICGCNGSLNADISTLIVFCLGAAHPQHLLFPLSFLCRGPQKLSFRLQLSTGQVLPVRTAVFSKLSDTCGNDEEGDFLAQQLLEPCLLLSTGRLLP